MTPTRIMFLLSVDHRRGAQIPYPDAHMPDVAPRVFRKMIYSLAGRIKALLTSRRGTFALWTGSVRTFTPENSSRSGDENFHIQPQRPGLAISKVEPHH